MNANRPDVLLEVEGLRKYFPIQKGFLRKTVGYVKAVDDVNLRVRRGEALGVVGESGCGKTTLGRCLVRVYEPTGGQILLRTDGEELPVSDLNGEQMRHFRRSVQMIFQDPYASLNPRMNVLETVGEPLQGQQPGQRPRAGGSGGEGDPAGGAARRAPAPLSAQL